MEPAPVAACDRTKRPGAAVRQPIVRSLRPPRLRPIVAENHQDAFASEHRSSSDPALDGRKHRGPLRGRLRMTDRMQHPAEHRRHLCDVPRQPRRLYGPAGNESETEASTWWIMNEQAKSNVTL